MQTIREPHCQQCGNTDNEDIRNQSYSGCCNERVIRNLPNETCTSPECKH